jgi:hypothetical protein
VEESDRAIATDAPIPGEVTTGVSYLDCPAVRARSKEGRQAVSVEIEISFGIRSRWFKA